MQNFDPKLFESQTQPARKESNTASNRAVRKADNVDEDGKSRKKFKLEEKKSKSKDTDKKDETSKSGLPSAFSLASKGAMKDSTEKEFNDSQEEFTGKEEGVDEKSSKNDDAPKVVNPLTSKLENAQGEIKAEAASKSAKAARTQMEQLLKTVVDSITQMKLDGKSETTIVIKHPPLFANAKLTLTTVDTAKGQFNITFSELNANAKHVLDMQSSKESLMRHLSEKGYVTHILVATTEKEETLLTASETEPQKQEADDQQQEGREEGKKREKRR